MNASEAEISVEGVKLQTPLEPTLYIMQLLAPFIVHSVLLNNYVFQTPHL